MSVRCAACLIALMVSSAISARVHAQAVGKAPGSVPDARPGKIRGVVFDSLLMLPIKNAMVTLLGRSETVISDDEGRFSFDTVPSGPQTIAFEAAELDSLGMGTMGATVTLQAGETARVTLSTPSLRTLWQRRCTAPLSSDSGIVWGTIRDASSNKLLSSAIAAFNWFDMRSGPATGLYLRDIRKEVVTDETGLFVACGVPPDVMITTAAIDTSMIRGKGASGFIQYSVGSRRLQRLDLVVSPDMIAPVNTPLVTRDDSTASARARGRATLKGIVLDDKKMPVADATIYVASADTSVITNGTGTFSISALPAGTHTIQTRRIGFAPVTQIVALRTDSVTEVQIVSTSVNVISVYNVRAEKAKGSDRAAFDLRRKMGFGSYVEEKDIARRTDMYGVVSQFSGVRVDRDGLDVRITVPSSYGGGRCVPLLYLDGAYTTTEAINAMQPTDLRAVEVYTRNGTAPMQYAAYSQCGVILFWSKNARW